MARTKQTATAPPPKRFERLPPHRGMQDEPVPMDVAPTLLEKLTVKAAAAASDAADASARAIAAATNPDIDATMLELKLAHKLLTDMKRAKAQTNELATRQAALQKKIEALEMEYVDLIDMVNRITVQGGQADAQDRPRPWELDQAEEAEEKDMPRLKLELAEAKSDLATFQTSVAGKRAALARLNVRIAAQEEDLTKLKKTREQPAVDARIAKGKATRAAKAVAKASAAIDLTSDETGTVLGKRAATNAALEKQIADAKVQLQAAEDVHKVSMGNFDKLIKEKAALVNDADLRMNNSMDTDYTLKWFTVFRNSSRDLKNLKIQKGAIEAQEQAQIATLRARVTELEAKLGNDGTKVQRTECALCGAEAELRCTGCKDEHYCSEDCQMADWAEHKLSCH